MDNKATIKKIVYKILPILIIIIAVFCILSICQNAYPEDDVAADAAENSQPSSPPAQQTKAAPISIYSFDTAAPDKLAGYTTLYMDHKARRVGDILTIVAIFFLITGYKTFVWLKFRFVEEM